MAYDNNNIISHRQKCIDFWVKTNMFLLTKMDMGEVERLVLEQMGVAEGSGWLYKRIDNNMRNNNFDPFFLKEHCVMFNWRETFFETHFPGDSWFTVESDQYGDEDEYFAWDDPFTRFITIPVQLTQNFDTVLALATAKVDPELMWLKSQVYFSNDEILGNESESKFKLDTLISDLHEPELDAPQGSLIGHSLKDHYDQVNLSFSNVAHIVVEVYQKGPKKLEELSIKAIIKSQISTQQLPQAIQNKVVDGMYTIKNSTPENITEEGRLMFEKVRRVFSAK